MVAGAGRDLEGGTPDCQEDLEWVYNSDVSTKTTAQDSELSPDPRAHCSTHRVGAGVRNTAGGCTTHLWGASA